MGAPDPEGAAFGGGMLTRAVPGAEPSEDFFGLPVSRFRASTPIGVNQVEVQKPRIPSPKMEAKIGIPASTMREPFALIVCFSMRCTVERGVQVNQPKDMHIDCWV